MKQQRRIRKVWIRIGGFLLALLVLGSVVYTALAQGGAPRVSTLSGTTEVSIDGQLNAGDLDGIGAAALWINQGQGRLCWEVSYVNINEPFMAHIHHAPAGAVGIVVATLDPITNGCTTAVDSVVLKDLTQNPQSYYINLHTPDFPGGALRGQLDNRGHGP